MKTHIIVGALVLILFCALSWRKEFRIPIYPSLAITIGEGSIGVVWWDTNNPAAVMVFGQAARVQPTDRALLLYPRVYWGMYARTVQCPLALVVLSYFLCISIVRYRRTKRAHYINGACVKCGYQLTGIVSNKCPECGCLTTASSSSAT
jgi:hypothetical protein